MHFATGFVSHFGDLSQGVYEQYGFTHVTHVIADNLAAGNQTWAQLKKRSKRVNVVTSTWVMDCVKEGRRHSMKDCRTSI